MDYYFQSVLIVGLSYGFIIGAIVGFVVRNSIEVEVIEPDKVEKGVEFELITDRQIRMVKNDN